MLDLNEALSTAHPGPPPRGKYEFGRWYRAYLMSSAWQDKRQLVIKRCNNVCEGCGRGEVNEVHHKHYWTVGYEFLFDLIGLCKSCHDRFHRLEKASKRIYRPDPSLWVGEDA